MHDGASCHRSKIVTEFLRKQKFKTLDWPGNSPDLNPIKNFWHLMKDKVAEEQPTSAKELIEAIKRNHGGILPKPNRQHDAPPGSCDKIFWRTQNIRNGQLCDSFIV